MKLTVNLWLKCAFLAGCLVSVPLAGSEPGTESNQDTMLPKNPEVAILKIKGLIYGYTFKSLQERIDLALESGATLIVLEMDTGGGTVDSALKISQYLKRIEVPTVAWINPQAYSAGIMIAAACDQIVMSPSSATGDCAPIVPGEDLSPTERAKALSPILEDFRDSASANGYSYTLFHAMCVLGVEAYLIDNPDSGERKLVNQADYAVMVQGDSLDKASDPEESEDGSVGAATVSVAKEADRGKWKLVQKLHDGKTLLTLSQKRAMEAGLAKAVVRDRGELEDYLGATSLREIQLDRVTAIAFLLTEPWVRTLLIIVMLMGAYAEFQAPGFGLPGLVAITALLVLLIAPFLIGLAEAWHVVLFGLGVLMLIAELVWVPGFGLLGVSGIVCMLIGLILMVVPSTEHGPIPLPAPEVTQRLTDSILSILAGFIAGTIGLYYLIRHFGSLPLFNRLILKSPAALPAGASVSAAHISGDEVLGGGELSEGMIGHAASELRPTGRAEFKGHMVDVVTQGEWIEPDQEIQILEIHGNRIVVEAKKSD